MQDNSQDETQIENYDSDATDIEDDNKGPQIHISIKQPSPVPLPENIIKDSKNVLSDDEDIDLYENNDFNPDMTCTERLLENSDLGGATNDLNSTKESLELDTNVNKLNNSDLNIGIVNVAENQNNSNRNIENCNTDSIPETEEYDFIPETQDFDNIQTHHIQVNKTVELSGTF